MILFALAAPVRAGALPSPWSNADIGNPAVAGDASVSNGTWTVVGGGSDIWGSSDQFQFVYQQVTGDVDLMVRVDSLVQTSTWAKAGVMIRSSLAANAAHGFALVSAGHGLAFQRRTATGRSSTNTSGESAAAPRWVRLVRHGSTLTAYSSADGTTWRTIGSDSVQLGATAYVGLAVTSHNTSTATTATASNVTVSAVGLPAGQANADIGSPAVPGSVMYSGGTYTVTAGGSDIWGYSDQFHYVYQAVAGDTDISFHLSSLAYSNSWAKAGVMIRETLDPASAHAYMLVSSGKGYAFQRRPNTGGASVSTSGGSGGAPGWVRLTRSGDQFSAYRSADGVQWTLVGTDTIPMASGVYVGIAVTSHSSSASTTAVGDHLSVSQSQSTNQPPTVSLTAPASGATYTAPASITLTANAADPENQLARVEFYSGTSLLGSATTSPYSYTWSNVAAGTYSLTAIAYDAAGASTQSAAVTVTVGAANQPPSVSISSPANGATYTAPATIAIAANASDPENQLAKVEFYSGNTLLGIDTASPYTFSWSNVAAGTYSLTAVAYDAAGASTQSGPVSVTVGTATNQPPTVSIIAPANGATFTAPATIAITANASDPENQLAKVQFYSGTTLLGTDTASPYTFSWSNVAAGTYSLSAIAYDAAGASTKSAAVSVTVGAANQPPTVSITSPANGATFTAPATIAITANASDPENQLAKVEFYNGTTLMGTDTASPYTFSWSNVAAGTYSLTAVAYDAAGSSTRSAAVSVTVGAAVSPVSTAFTASADDATLVTNYVFEVFSSTADTTTATPIATLNLGKPAPDGTNTITVDITTFFYGLTAGNYQATVSAVGSGGSSRSTPITFTR